MITQDDRSEKGGAANRRRKRIESSVWSGGGRCLRGAANQRGFERVPAGLRVAAPKKGEKER